MAWTHHIKSKIDVFAFINQPQGDVAVAVDRSIYIIGHEETERELQVHIFHVETSTWDVVRFTDVNSASIPRKRYIAVAHGDSILVYARDYSMECSLFVLNTKTLQWNRLSVDGDIYENEDWWGGCMLHGELYILKDTNRNFQLWALDLNIMRWRFVSDTEFSFPYYPVRFFAYETRIYMRLEHMWDKSTDISVVYFDTVTHGWKCLDPPRHMELFQPAWASFFYSNHFYYVSGIHHEGEFVSRYSLERNKWERIRFEGVPPLDTDSIGNVVVLDNKAFFLEFWTAGMYVLDLKPSLKTRCLAAILRHKLDTSGLPKSLQTELSKFRHSE